MRPERFSKYTNGKVYDRNIRDYVPLERVIPILMENREVRLFDVPQKKDGTFHELLKWTLLKIKEQLSNLTEENLASFLRELPKDPPALIFRMRSIGALGNQSRRDEKTQLLLELEQMKKNEGEISTSDRVKVSEQDGWSLSALRNYYGLRDQKKKRVCMTCAREFPSSGYQNRLCFECSKKPIKDPLIEHRLAV